jgi:hypothetical protein
MGVIVAATPHFNFRAAVVAGASTFSPGGEG